MAWRQVIVWTNADPIHWRIYAALGADELNIAMEFITYSLNHRGDRTLTYHWNKSYMFHACWQWYIYRAILTHWGRVTHICVGNLIIIGSDNGLSPGRRQAIIWTNAGILLIGTLGTNFTEILIEIQTFSLEKCVWKCRLRNGGHFASVSMC